MGERFVFIESNFSVSSLEERIFKSYIKSLIIKEEFSRCVVFSFYFKVGKRLFEYIIKVKINMKFIF